MKLKIKLEVFMILGILFALSIIINNNINFKARISEVNSEFSEELDKTDGLLKISALNEKIHINNNWSITESTYTWCTGSGTYPDPYIIKDLIIDGGGSGHCILIENSNVYFKIENCTTFNAGDYHGITLSNVNNSLLFKNNCSYNNRGISLTSCDNNTIMENTANNNDNDGIYLAYCSNNMISENTAKDNNMLKPYLVYGNGIYINIGSNNKILGNNLDDNGHGIYLLNSDHDTVSGNTAKDNRFYGVFWQTGDNISISSNTFTYNAYGIYLEHILQGNISGNSLNHNEIGVGLLYSDENSLSENEVNNNIYYGIYIHLSDSNIISSNTANNNGKGVYLLDANNNQILNNNLIGNEVCWEELDCEDNVFENNECARPLLIPAFSIFIIIGTVAGISLILAFYTFKVRKRSS
ncbi:MAG: right-handed parallel beta-helix repeat-containing protein [Candidatus Thorarchaeota archaeon]